MVIFCSYTALASMRCHREEDSGLVGLNEYRVTCTPLSLRGIIWIRFKLTSFMMWISSELVPWRFKDFGDTHDSRKGLKSSDS